MFAIDVGTLLSRNTKSPNDVCRNQDWGLCTKRLKKSTTTEPLKSVGGKGEKDDIVQKPGLTIQRKHPPQGQAYDYSCERVSFEGIYLMQRFSNFCKLGPPKGG